MGRILIYESGQKYEIDSTLIYVPIFGNKNENRNAPTGSTSGISNNIDTVSEYKDQQNSI